MDIAKKILLFLLLGGQLAPLCGMGLQPGMQVFTNDFQSCLWRQELVRALDEAIKQDDAIGLQCALEKSKCIGEVIAKSDFFRQQVFEGKVPGNITDYAPFLAQAVFAGKWKAAKVLMLTGINPYAFYKNQGEASNLFAILEKNGADAKALHAIEEMRSLYLEQEVRILLRAESEKFDKIEEDEGKKRGGKLKLVEAEQLGNEFRASLAQQLLEKGIRGINSVYLSAAIHLNVNLNGWYFGNKDVAPLFRAVRAHSLEHNFTELIKLMCACSSLDINALDVHGRTVLHYAISKASLKNTPLEWALVNMLLKNKRANLNIKSLQNETALSLLIPKEPYDHEVISSYDLDLIKLLLEHGADPYLPVDEVGSVVDRCNFAGNNDLLEILLEGRAVYLSLIPARPEPVSLEAEDIDMKVVAAADSLQSSAKGKRAREEEKNGDGNSSPLKKARVSPSNGVAPMVLGDDSKYESKENY